MKFDVLPSHYSGYEFRLLRNKSVELTSRQLVQAVHCASTHSPGQETEHSSKLEGSLALSHSAESTTTASRTLTHLQTQTKVH